MSATRGLTLAKRYSQIELLSLMHFIEGDPRSKNRDRKSIYIHTPKAREMLNSLDWAISYQLGLGSGRIKSCDRIPVMGGFGYVEPNEPKEFAAVSRFFEKAMQQARARTIAGRKTA